jgi:hypothetical protein
MENNKNPAVFDEGTFSLLQLIGFSRMSADIDLLGDRGIFWIFLPYIDNISGLMTCVKKEK